MTQSNQKQQRLSADQLIKYILNIFCNCNLLAYSDIDDINTDTFHLDIWDHDGESCVMDAVSRLNEVRGVRGLGRFFKQVCQSARQGSQDDFLGCLNIPVCDIPSSGIDSWFKLEARSQRSSVQGRIHLKLRFSTREDEGTSEEVTDHLITIYEKTNLFIMQHEAQQYDPSWTWGGELPGPAMSILHQLSVQADLNDFQIAMARFVSAAKLNRCMPLDPKFLHRLLMEVESNWNQNMPDNPPSRDIEQWLAVAFTSFLDRSLHQIGRHREIFPALHSPSLVRLELLLRCLCLLGTMRTFRSVCPFSKGVRGEVVNALRKGSIAWAKNIFRESQNPILSNGLAHFVSTLSADIQLGQTYYHSLFDK